MNPKRPAWIRIASTMSAPTVLFLVTVFPNPYVFGVSLTLWFGFFLLLQFKYHVPRHQTALNFMTVLSFLTLLLLVETVWLRWFFVIISTIVFFFIAYWSEPRLEHAIHIKEKPLRRMMMMLYVFNVYAFFVGLFALYLYFPRFPFAFLSIAGGAYAGVGAFMIWSLYFKFTADKLFIWTLIVALCVVELMWVMKLLPFGYLALGFLLVWLWYMIQLFARFHLSPKGILWKKQIGFLITNGILFVLVLYFIRWI
ncbi:hypothetical protein HOF40_01590 [Candidatus Parcubacteria bacterium]|jgi:hypothetical protein|nr:hypothetical protein [Candidatus Parcubacteria bacterium]MBT3948758.1 hypothetical protein [Candidatus Parcubacteria bacterium]